MEKFDVKDLVFNNSKGGFYESYLCTKHQKSEGGPGKHANLDKMVGAKLLQCLKVKKESFKKA